jgi:acetoin utilization protein AcuB
MKKEVVVIEKDATVIETIHLMKEKNVQRLPVMDKGRIAGIVTEKMLAEFSPSRATSLDLWEIHYILSKTPVTEAMNPNPTKVKPETEISECAKILHDQKLGGVIVVDDNDNLVGIFTVTDILEALIDICNDPQAGQE